MSMLRPLLVAVLAAASLTACGRNSGLSCENPQRYAGSGTIQPVRVPDGLSPPDESRALTIPPAPDGSAAPPAECLETPPRYSEEPRDPA